MANVDQDKCKHIWMKDLWQRIYRTKSGWKVSKGFKVRVCLVCGYNERVTK